MFSTKTTTTLTSLILATSVVVILYAPWHPPGWEGFSFALALGLIGLGGYVTWRSTAGDPTRNRLSSPPGVCFFAAAVCITEDYQPFGEPGLLIILGLAFLTLGGYLTWRTQSRA
ncbi:hypothetical protein [Neolewinella litorea]|uniref:Uncharacterized protein n=1 Tax=Neolewinella litorea TaxID=2562452 RepID=A0A4S4NQJ3_9BACT|nr:hypothetical protein [Neolewinella litorea]THH40618.1 hypothetical protein E4021_07765 [Neolewinella litorea]